jgi:hypothetical protein
MRAKATRFYTEIEVRESKIVGRKYGPVTRRSLEFGELLKAEESGQTGKQ